jgi:predicted Zn-dependent protease
MAKKIEEKVLENFKKELEEACKESPAEVAVKVKEGKPDSKVYNFATMQYEAVNETSMTIMDKR